MIFVSSWTHEFSSTDYLSFLKSVTQREIVANYESLMIANSLDTQRFQLFVFLAFIEFLCKIEN